MVEEKVVKHVEAGAHASILAAGGITMLALARQEESRKDRVALLLVAATLLTFAVGYIVVEFV